jgi:Protein of unknown function (DUF4242)
MPRFLVERTFPEAIALPLDIVGAQAGLGIGEGNGRVSWVHSYVRPDKTASFCIFDAPDAESVRFAAAATRLPVGRITEVRVLSPYFYL